MPINKRRGIFAHVERSARAMYILLKKRCAWLLEGFDFTKLEIVKFCGRIVVNVSEVHSLEIVVAHERRRRLSKHRSGKR